MVIYEFEKRGMTFRAELGRVETFHLYFEITLSMFK